jgi:hypothetical protein
MGKMGVCQSGRVVALLASMEEKVLDWLHSSSENFEIGLGDVFKKACSAGNCPFFLLSLSFVWFK